MSVSVLSIVDADAHVIEGEHTWDYLEGGDQQYRPQTVAARDGDGGGRMHWLIDGHLCPRADGDPSIPMGAKDLTDVPERLRIMNEVGIELQVIYPSLFNHFYTHRPEVEVALCRSYNRSLADACSRSGGRLRWVVAPPLLSLPDALAELEFGKRNGACGVFVRPLEGERQPADPYFDPLYHNASALDLPVCIHAGNGNKDLNAFLMNASRSHYFLAVTPVLGAFVEIVTTGLPERFPNLRLGFIEAGAQWVPYLIKESLRRHERIGMPGVITDEFSAMRDKRLFVTCRTDDDLPYVLRWSGEDNLIMGTDFGHKDAASEIDALRTLRTGEDLPAGVLHRIVDENPRAFYGL